MSWPVTAQPRQETTFTVDDDAGGLTIFEKRVAAAVIASAVRDYANPQPTHPSNQSKWRIRRGEAEAFLYGEESSLEFWCDVAGWEVSWVRRRSRTVEQQSRRTQESCGNEALSTDPLAGQQGSRCDNGV